MKTKDSPIRRYIQRRKPRGLGGRSPQSLRWGDSPCIRPPNILRSIVVGCARKYAKSKKRCFCCEERVMYEVSCMIFNKVRSGKSVKIRKTWSMTKKGHQKFLPPKWEKTSSWSTKIFSVPPNSAPCFRHWLYINSPL